MSASEALPPTPRYLSCKVLWVAYVVAEPALVAELRLWEDRERPVLPLNA